MKEGQGRTKILITVMTYPHPSKRYRELVCTAGITEKGEWLRLYPVDYRYREPHQKFRKFQWVEVALSPYRPGNDPRRESRKPDLDTLHVLGALFLKECDRRGSENAAAESVRHQYLNVLCGPKRDTRFFVGTRLPYNVWMVVGVFWPPKVPKGPHGLFK